MSFMNFNTQMKEIFWGNTLLIICCLFYLAWWIIAFRPNAKKGLATGILIFIAFLIGIIAIMFLVSGIRSLPHDAMLLPSTVILWGGVIAYFVLLGVTYLVFHRQITTELLLILGWAVLELCMINVLYGAGYYSMRTTIIWCVIVVIAVIISLVCYVLYYQLKGMTSFIDGMIPLIIVALVMTGLGITMAVE